MEVEEPSVAIGVKYDKSEVKIFQLPARLFHSSPAFQLAPTPARAAPLLRRSNLPKPTGGEPHTPENESAAMTGAMLEDEVESTCSTPYVSAPSSPGRGPPPLAFFFSAPASPVHYILSSSPPTSAFAPSAADFSADFEFSARFSNGFSGAAPASMTSADELFLNGQIRPMKLSSHLQRPQNLAPLLDLEEGDNEGEGGENGGEGVAAAVAGEISQETSARGREVRMRSKSMQRRARSMSPLRNWRNRDGGGRDRRPSAVPDEIEVAATPADDAPSDASTPSVSASSSRSNSTSSRSSKRWVFLMDFLHRSKSEGRGRSSGGGGKDKIWSSISFSPVHKEKKQSPSVSTPSSPNRKPKQRAAHARAPAKKPAVKGRIPPSPHELHYTVNRAQAEELRKKTYLPYRQGLLGCLGFSSRSYVAMNGLTGALNAVSSR